MPGLPTTIAEEPPQVRPVPRFVTFFACYPEAIGLTDRDIQVTFTDQSLKGYDVLGTVPIHIQRSQILYSLEPAQLQQVFVSIRMHRVAREGSLIVRDIEDVNGVVRQVAPALAIDVAEAHQPDEKLQQTFTVLEMVTPLVVFDGEAWVPANFDNSLMGLTLTRSLDMVCNLLTAYRVASGQVLPAPSRERIGPIIQWGTRPAAGEPGVWDVKVDAPDSVMNMFAGLNRGLPLPLVDQTTIGKMLGYSIQRRLGFPIHAVMELQADADAAIELRGDYRTAVMILYTASEVFMDLALMMLLWEEGMTPEEAAAEFNPKFVARVRAKYHERIGGGWSTKQGQVNRWHRDLASLRHRVTHAGESVDRDAAEAARKGYADLRAHLLDRLAYSVGKYPKTAGVLVTAEGFRRRGKWSRRIEAASAMATFETFAEFAAWRDAVIGCRSNVDS